MASSSSGTSTRESVFYCAICSFPPEYCEFGPRKSKCKTWLHANNSTLFTQIYPDADQVATQLATLSVEERERQTKEQDKLDKEAAKKERKEVAKEEKEAKKRSESKVTIKRIERGKRKRITAIHGLEAFGFDVKMLAKLAKLFAGKFATGASVTQNNQGEDEIVIQGDVADEVLDLFDETSGKFAEMIGNGKIPMDNITVVDEGKKKS